MKVSIKWLNSKTSSHPTAFVVLLRSSMLPAPIANSLAYAHICSLSLSFSLSLSLSFFLSLSHTLSLSLSLVSLTFSVSVSLGFNISLSHSLCQSLFLTLPLSLSLSVSLFFLYPYRRGKRRAAAKGAAMPLIHFLGLARWPPGHAQCCPSQQLAASRQGHCAI